MIRFVFVFLLFSTPLALFANNEELKDSLQKKVIDLDATLDSIIRKPNNLENVNYRVFDSIKQDQLIVLNKIDYSKVRKEVLLLMQNKTLVTLDSTLKPNASLFLPLVIERKNQPLNFRNNLLTYKYNMGPNTNTLYNFSVIKPESVLSKEEHQRNIAKNAFFHVFTNSTQLIAYHTDDLPSIKEVESHYISPTALNKLVFENNQQITHSNKLVVQKVAPLYWVNKANGYLQFSQNYISKNWHQGGNDNIAILGTLTAKFNYDNKKGIQWENNAEWRAGFNSIEGDTVLHRKFNTNDDVLKFNSKLGVKASGKFYYSGLFEFSTPLFTTYKAINSKDKKASFMTPVRINISAGLDYKLDKKLSVMLSPVSYKYIFLNDPTVSPKLFGIPVGEHILSEIGSSLKIQNNLTPTKEITVDSKFSFYTNYEKVEIDWEITCNFQINRFLSTRIMLNPRYDNSVILAQGEKTKLQFKEILTFGLSYRLLK